MRSGEFPESESMAPVFVLHPLPASPREEDDGAILNAKTLARLRETADLHPGRMVHSKTDGGGGKL